MEVYSSLEEIEHDVANLDNENHLIVVNHSELDYNSQQEFGTRDHRETLNIVEGGSDPINIEIDVVINIDIEEDIITSIELNQLLNESVHELIHFLAKTKEV